MENTSAPAKPAAPYMVNAYLEWSAQEGVPVVEDFAIDLHEAEVAPWARYDARGGIFNLKGRGDFSSIFLFELKPGGKTSPQRHLYEEIIYVVSGHGSTSITGPQGERHSFEWGPNSLFAIPLNVTHQHFNGSGTQAARFASTNNLCVTMNLYHEESFVFSNTHDFPSRMGKSSYFNGEGEFIPYRPGAHMWETNFIPDLNEIQLKSWDARGAGSSSLMFVLANGTLGAHSSEIPVGSYKKAHRHGSGRHVFCVSGSGYSLTWYEGDEDYVRIPWRHGVVYAPPDGMFHQHFNISPGPARYLATGIGSRRHPFLDIKRRSEREVDLSIKKGGRQVEYEDQDPRIHRIWEEELAKAGLTQAASFLPKTP